jgi:hypothetical protein
MDSLFEVFLRGIDSYAFSRNLFSGLKYVIALPTQTLSSYRHVQCYFLESVTQFGIENTYGQLYKCVCASESR